MTDLELTKLCAEKMGYSFRYSSHGNGYLIRPGKSNTYFGALENLLKIYDPLHDDAQCMAMVKKFHLHILPGLRTPAGRQDWHVEVNNLYDAWNADLNRAIVECVASLP